MVIRQVHGPTLPVIQVVTPSALPAHGPIPPHSPMSEAGPGLAYLWIVFSSSADSRTLDRMASSCGG